MNAIRQRFWRLEYGIALLVLATPFAENAATGGPQDTPIRLALAALTVLLAIGQVVRLVHARQRPERPAMFAAALAFLGAALISIPFAVEVGDATSKFALLAGSVAIYLMIATALLDWKRLEPVLGALVLAGLIVSVHTIVQYVTGDTSTVGFLNEQGKAEYRVTSVFPHPNQLGGYLAVMVALGVGLWAVFERRWMQLACAALAALATVAVVLTFSRGALLALAALPFAYVRPHHLRDKRALAAIAIPVVALLLLAPTVWRDRVEGALNFDSPEIEMRFDFYEGALDVFADRPVVGVGLNGFGDAYDNLGRAATAPGEDPELEHPETAHNVFLNALAEQGMLGLAALLWLAVAFAIMVRGLLASADRRIGTIGRTLLGAGLVVLVHNLIDVTLIDAKSSILIWTLIGIGAACTAIDRRPVEPEQPAAPLVPANDSFLTVVIATHDRPETLRVAVESLLAARPGFDRIVVVDQSAGDATAEVVRQLGSPQIQLLRLPEPGASRARNAGAAVATGEYIAFLDDDVVVPDDWCTSLRDSIERNRRPDVIFGEIRPDRPVDRRSIENSTYSIEQTREWPSSTHPGAIGLSAQMIIRLDAFSELGGFDERLGPGTSAYGAEDVEINYRLLRAGYRAVTTPDFWLTHMQWRSDEALPDHFYRYNFGHSAVCAKHLRLGDFRALLLFAAQVRDDLRMFASAARRRSMLRLRVGLKRVEGTWAGLVRGWAIFGSPR